MDLDEAKDMDEATRTRTKRRSALSSLRFLASSLSLTVHYLLQHPFTRYGHFEPTSAMQKSHARNHVCQDLRRYMTQKELKS